MKKLYDENAYCFSFDATVIACVPSGEHWLVTLDETAFFPEEGGQYGDTGTLGDARVLDTQLSDGEIVHTTDRPLTVGTVVHGALDADRRYRRMQNHSGEHLACGILHRLYGFENVGFHLSDDDMTFDVDGVLTKEQLREVETLAQKAIYENVPIRAWYPTDDELDGMEYRAKIERKEGLRIVEIEGYDRCACCAPHVRATGEIGTLRILDFMNYKGGMRIHAQCGYDALDDARERYDRGEEISHLLSAKQDAIVPAVSRLLAENGALRGEIGRLRRAILDSEAEKRTPSASLICFFDGMDNADLRYFVNRAAGSVETVTLALSGNDENGYLYVCASEKISVKTFVRAMHETLGGRGGGSDKMASGTVANTKEKITEYFERYCNETVQ